MLQKREEREDDRKLHKKAMEKYKEMEQGGQIKKQNQQQRVRQYELKKIKRDIINNDPNFGNFKSKSPMKSQKQSGVNSNYETEKVTTENPEEESSEYEEATESEMSEDNMF